LLLRAVALSLSVFAPSAAVSRPSAATTVTFATRRTHGSQPLHLRHFSSISRASRHAKMSIQRIAPVFLPVISAGNLQIVQFVP